MLITVLFVCLGYVCLVGQSKEFAGPYDVVFRGFYLCDDPGDGTVMFGTKFSKINRTSLSYTSNVTFPHGVNDDMLFKLEASVFGNGGWRPNFITHTMKACSDFMKIFPGGLQSFYLAAGYNLTSCPVPPGTYEVKNWIFKVTIAASIVPYNRYRACCTLIEKGIRRSCFLADLDVVPQRMKKN